MYKRQTLIGPNGAGKSTILKSLIRQLKLVGGAVWLDNTSMERMTDKEISRKMAVVMTERIHPELMTCEDVVATGRYPYTGTLGILGAEDHEKVKSAMQLVHAWELRDRDFSAISDGQRPVSYTHLARQRLRFQRVVLRCLRFWRLAVMSAVPAVRLWSDLYRSFLAAI